MDQPGKVIEPTWQFTPDAQGASDAKPPSNAATGDSVSWTASEFVAHQKNPAWYLLLIIAALGLAAGVFLITRDIISVVMIIIVAVVMAILGGRQPRTLSYKVDAHGVSIGQKFYDWSSFKSFSVIEEDAINSIYLVPLKRFMPAITVYYAPDDEEKILSAFGTYLPHEERQRDFVDKLMHKIRF